MNNTNFPGFVILVERKVNDKLTHRELAQINNVVCVFSCFTTAATHVEKMEAAECFESKDSVFIVHGSTDLNLGWAAA